MRMHHLAVQVRDLGVAESFYCGVLGLPIQVRHADDAGRPRSIWLDLEGGAFLALERCTRERDATRDAEVGWHCVALGIDPTERELWRTRLESAGIAVERESAFTLYFRDPDGTLVGLSHHPHAHQI